MPCDYRFSGEFTKDKRRVLPPKLLEGESEDETEHRPLYTIRGSGREEDVGNTNASEPSIGMVRKG